MLSCGLRLHTDGTVEVRWTSTVAHGTDARWVGFSFRADRVRNLRCTGDSVRDWTVVRLGRRVVIIGELRDSPSEGVHGPEPAAVEVSYAFQAVREIWTPEAGVSVLSREALPRLHSGRDDGSIRQLLRRLKRERSPEAHSSIDLSLEWDPATTRVFGPIARPEAGHAELGLSPTELADLVVYFGDFQRSAAAHGFQLWVPSPLATSWSEDGYLCVASWAGRVRDLLGGLFAPARAEMQHILLKPPQAGAARFFGRTILIRYPRSAPGNLSEMEQANLVMQLGHELSHAWWVPAARSQPDGRVWGVVEGVGTACSFLAMRHFLSASLEEEIMPSKVAHHTDLIRRRFRNLVRHYQSRFAAAGLRFGHVLFALSVSQGRAFLESIGCLLNSLSADVQGQQSLGEHMTRCFGRERADCFLEMLDNPRPPVASLRFITKEKEGDEIRARFRFSKHSERLLDTIRGVGGFTELVSGGVAARSVVRFFLRPGTSPTAIRQLLSPGFVIDRRVLQWSRVERSALLGALSRQAWLLRDQPPARRMRDTVKRAALGLFEILVESDGPIGYELLAQAVEGISRRFALRLKECAASRGG